MTPYDPQSDPAREGQRRHDAFYQHANELHQLGADLSGHRAVSEQLRSAHTGLYDHATGYDLAATLASQQPTVGGDWYGRPLEQNGGAFDHHVTSPHPAAVDLRFVNQPAGAPTGESSLLKWQRENR